MALALRFQNSVPHKAFFLIDPEPILVQRIKNLFAHAWISRQPLHLVVRIQQTA
jgi:hypothetical protein